MILTTIALLNRKGGVGKTTTTANLGIGLVRQGKKVLVIDADDQGNLTQMLGWQDTEKLPYTLASVMGNIINEEQFDPLEGLLHHAEGVDLLPANAQLAAIETAFSNTIGRERILREYISLVKPTYDYVLIDCKSSLDLKTMNALTAADKIIIPVIPEFLPAMGLTDLLRTVSQTKKYLNPKLDISGILLSRVDVRTNFTKSISREIRAAYNSRVFNTYIPNSIRVTEASATGQSIFQYAPAGKAATAYMNLTMEVLGFEKQRTKGHAAPIR